MSNINIFISLIDEHLGAKRMFGAAYDFKTKQNDILFRIQWQLSKQVAEQKADQKTMDALTKKMNKRQVLIDGISNHLNIAESVTEEDLPIERT